MKEKETKNGLRLLLTFDNVKSVNKALELLEGI
jgi:transcription-repair coupling factor (superfamily II helicase)